MASKTCTAGNSFLARAYDAKRPEDLQAVYDDWAEQYNSDVTSAAHNYIAPRLSAELVVRAANNTDVDVLDAGCGTGLVGAALHQLGVSVVDGLDVSSGMLGQARKTGAYRNLGTADLTRPVGIPDNTYGSVVCVGTLTHGHVGPEAIAELVRLTKPGGHMVATIVDDIWESNGYKAETERLVGAGKAKFVSAEIAPYRPGAGVNARFLILQAV